MAINPMDAQGGGIAGAMPQGMPQGGGADPRRPQGQVGGDLLKALAAQKLLRDKQMAERQMAMSQEADANTVVAKNEAELSQRSLAEVSKGVSDVLTKKNVDKQKNMQRMAQGPRGRPPQRAPQGAGTQTAGIANNPRPNMAMMAQGGIVGEPQEYAAGMLIKGAQIALPYIGRGIAGLGKRLGKKFLTQPKTPRKVGLPVPVRPALPAKPNQIVPPGTRGVAEPVLAGTAVLTGGLPNMFGGEEEAVPNVGTSSGGRERAMSAPDFSPQQPVVAPEPAVPTGGIQDLAPDAGQIERDRRDRMLYTLANSGRPGGAANAFVGFNEKTAARDAAAGQANIQNQIAEQKNNIKEKEVEILGKLRQDQNRAGFYGKMVSEKEKISQQLMELQMSIQEGYPLLATLKQSLAQSENKSEAKRLSEEIAGLEAQISIEYARRGEDLIATNRALTQILNELQSKMGVAGGVDISNMGLSKAGQAAAAKYLGNG